MIITYYGKQFFKITQGEMVLAFNPVSKESKTKINSHFGADIALVTTNHPDYNGLGQLEYGERVPFAVTGPGDYEVKEIFIKGILSSANFGDKKYINTIYSLSVDSINIAFLGSLSDETLSKEALESINEPDILFIPVGGKDLGLIDVKAAAKIASSLEPKMIIPMEYDEASLKMFLKEMGEDGVESVDKLTLKRKDLEGKATEVVVLSSVN
ncbi:MAG: MBL fold metallo-hydrolase [Candidatus Paceibacterota bacterium]